MFFGGIGIVALSVMSRKNLDYSIFTFYSEIA